MTINTVLITESEQSSATIHSVMAGNDYQIIYEASNFSDLMAIDLQQPELIVFCLSVPNDTLLAQLKFVTTKYPIPIVIFTDAGGDHAIEQAIQAGVSAYVVDGLVERRVLSIIRAALARFNHNQSLFEEVSQLRRNLADRKTIDRAKGIIMEQRQCSENEAYTLLRSQAMSQNMKLAALAETVVSTANIFTARRH